MIAIEKFQKLAKTFMDVVHGETGLPVLIYDVEGRIVQATDKTRIGDLHPNALKMIQEGENDSAVTRQDAEENPLVREGYNCAIVSGGRNVGGFGITGPLEEVRPLARMAVKLIDSWMGEFTLQEELEQRVQERTLTLKMEIEARKQAENILRENQARFQAFTKAIPDILFVFDQDGRYVEVFTSSQDLLMNNPSQLKGKLIQEILPNEVAMLHHRIIRETAEQGRGRHFEYELEVPKGRCWFESHTAPIMGLNHDKKLVASSVRDITRRKMIEKEISEKEKLSVVIETAGAVCHEFNQPLQVITGCCELLTVFSDLDPEVSKFIEKISKEAGRMGKLNRNLMNITSYKTKTYQKSKIIDIDKSIED